MLKCTNIHKTSIHTRIICVNTSEIQRPTNYSKRLTKYVIFCKFDAKQIPLIIYTKILGMHKYFYVLTVKAISLRNCMQQ